MTAKDGSATRVRFGDFEVDLQAGELRRRGAKVRLPGQPFQVLAMLLAQPGQLVTREALQQQLWSSDTFVDFDRGLNKAINRVRDALGDSADEPRLIETLPKRGYRFIGSIEPKPDRVPILPGAAQAMIPAPASHDPADTESRDRAARRRASPRVWLTAFLILIAIALARFAWYRGETPAAEPLLRSSVLPPANTSFVPFTFSVSPDGTRLAFSAANRDGTDSLWLRTLAGVAVRKLDGTDGGRFPFWSPDSRRVGFFADRKLKTVDVASGAVQTLADARRPRGGTWNADGRIVFAADVVGPLAVISSTGGTPHPINVHEASTLAGAGWPIFLPDERHFFYVADNKIAAGGHDVYVGSLDASASVRIVERTVGSVGYGAGHLFFVRDGSLMAQPFSFERLQTTGAAVVIAEHELEAAPDFFPSGFSISRGGVLVYQSTPDFTTRLTWVDGDGQEIETLSRAGDRDPALSPDGRLLATSCDEERSNRLVICVTDLRRHVTSRVTSGPHDRFPVWSGDGRTLAYLGTVDGSPRAYEAAVDGSTPARVLPEGVGIPTSRSADGGLLFFGPTRDNVSLGAYSAATGAIASLGPGSEGQFSPDGRWLLFGGQDGIIVRRVQEPGVRIQIAGYGGSQPRWRRDGREIFYVTGDKKLMAVGFDPMTGQATAPRAMFVTRIVATALAGFQYDVAPDGHFLINTLPSSTSPLTLLTGWRSHVPR
jgi:DNA-binding winged helix-turn-helix (wHTH) protein/Tol biopolymer transport system component